MTPTDTIEHDDPLAAHLRRTLHAVAATLADGDADTDPQALPVAPGGVRHAGRLHRPGIPRGRAALAAAAVVLLVAATVWFVGSDRGRSRGTTDAPPVTVDDGAPPQALVKGRAVGGGTWWVEPTSPADVAPWSDCPAVPGIELRSTDGQPIGGSPLTDVHYSGEWREPDGDFRDCPDVDAWLADPTRFALQAGRTANRWREPERSDWVVLLAVHPDVAIVAFTSDSRRTNPGQGTATFALSDNRDGPRFAAFRVPWDATAVHVQLLGAPRNQVVAERTAVLSDVSDDVTPEV